MAKKKTFDLDEEVEKELKAEQTAPESKPVESEPAEETKPETPTVEHEGAKPAEPELKPHYAVEDFRWLVLGQLLNYKKNQIISEQIPLKHLIAGKAPIKEINGNVHQCPKCSYVFAGPMIDGSK